MVEENDYKCALPPSMSMYDHLPYHSNPDYCNRKNIKLYTGNVIKGFFSKVSDEQIILGGDNGEVPYVEEASVNETTTNNSESNDNSIVKDNYIEENDIPIENNIITENGTFSEDSISEINNDDINIDENLFNTDSITEEQLDEKIE